MGKANKKIYGKVVGKDASDRPGWKGPSYIKKKAPAPSPLPKETPEEDTPEPKIPIELQQLLLNIFRDTFREVLDSNERQTLLQDVKNALYERDFARAFGKREFLETYSVRWSPSRALCYQAVLVDIAAFLRDVWPVCGVLSEDEKEDGEVVEGSERLKAVCFGGGAAEVVAFGGFVKRVLDCGGEDVTGKEVGLEEEIASLSVSNPLGSVQASTQETLATSDPVKRAISPSQDTAEAEPSTTVVTQSSESPSSTSMLELILIDNAQWGEVITKLSTGLTAPPTISKYANAAAKAANVSLLKQKDISSKFQSIDILTMTSSQLTTLFGTTPILVTLLFTLNELYTASITSTTKFLLNLTMAASKGTLLLVVDSPGSYSETKVAKGEEGKKYPMHWLMDHTLLDTAKVDGVAAWEKVVSDEARWFRVPEELRYPISLENMRYQIHLYRRVMKSFNTKQ